MLRNLQRFACLRNRIPNSTKSDSLHGNVFNKMYSIYDPPYLDALKPEIEPYEPINVEMVSADFALVESYQRVVHRIANLMHLDVNDCWAVPARKSRIVKYKPGGTLTDAEYNLPFYVRNVQVVDLPNNLAPIFIELAQAALPQGVSLTVRKHCESDDIERYVPDHELEQLKTELVAAGGPSKKSSGRK